MTVTLDDFLAGEQGRFLAKLRAKKPRAPRDPAAVKPKRGNPEKTLQREVFRDLKTHAPSIDVTAYIATAQGTGTTAEARMRYGQAMKSFGVVAGEPDLKCSLPGGVTVYLELKSAVGVVSPVQRARHDRLRALGNQVYVVRSVKEARAALATHGVVFTAPVRRAAP